MEIKARTINELPVEWLKKLGPIAKSNIQFAKFLEKTNGVWHLSTIAFKKPKGKILMAQEAERHYFFGKRMANPNLYFTNMAGYNLLWSESDFKKRCKAYSYWSFTDDYYLKDLKMVEERDEVHMSVIPMYSGYEIEEVLKEFLPYFSIEGQVDNSTMCYPEDFIKIYKNNLPASELLCKAGFSDLAWSASVCHAKGESRKKILNFIKANKERIKRHDITCGQIVYCARHDLTFDRIEEVREIKELAATINSALGPISAKAGITKEMLSEMRTYLNGYHTYPIQSYANYLLEKYKEGFDITKRNIMFPRDLAEAIGEEAFRKNKDLSEKIKAIAEKLGMIQEGDIKVMPMESVKDFIKTGIDLDMCVGTYGYDKKMAKGETFCCVVYLKDKPMECCEISMKTREIIQLYGHGDKPSPIHQQAYQLCQRYAQSVQLGA